MTQYEPIRDPFGVAVGTDPHGSDRADPLTWRFTTGYGENRPRPDFVSRPV
jgi:hypothetical protein